MRVRVWVCGSVWVGAMNTLSRRTHGRDCKCVCVCVCPYSAVKEISDLLNTGLDEETLKVCVQLLEAGVNPEALAAVVRELRRETAALRVSGLSSASSTTHVHACLQYYVHVTYRYMYIHVCSSIRMSIHVYSCIQKCGWF